MYMNDGMDLKEENEERGDRSFGMSFGIWLFRVDLISSLVGILFCVVSYCTYIRNKNRIKSKGKTL